MTNNNTDTDTLKKKAADYALRYIDDDCIVGVGTGSTVNHFITALATIKHRINGAVASSLATKALLQAQHIPVIDANAAPEIPVYIDGADEASPQFNLIKGGGGALTGEKIIAHMAKQFICIIDPSKQVERLGAFPVAVEVLPLARSFVGRELVKLGGDPAYRSDFVSDYGNHILDVYNLDMTEPLKLEQTINQIPGVVCNGLFAQRKADVLVVGKPGEIEVKKR